MKNVKIQALSVEKSDWLKSELAVNNSKSKPSPLRLNRKKGDIIWAKENQSKLGSILTDHGGVRPVSLEQVSCSTPCKGYMNCQTVKGRTEPPTFRELFHLLTYSLPEAKCCDWTLLKTPNSLSNKCNLHQSSRPKGQHCSELEPLSFHSTAVCRKHFNV